VPLKLIKITVEAGLYNLSQNSPACTCQDLDMCMRDPRTISVDSLTNGVVSMRELGLSIAVPSKCRDDDALTLFNATLSWGQAYALCTLVMCGKDHPVEKAKDMETRMKIMYSAQPYSISEEMLNEILEADPEQRLPYLHGMSKSAQQKLRYALYGQVGNLFNEKVFTKTGVQPSEMVKLHLGLKDLVPERGLMDM